MAVCCVGSVDRGSPLGMLELPRGHQVRDLVINVARVADLTR
jgi:hypothetical protein